MDKIDTNIGKMYVKQKRKYEIPISVFSNSIKIFNQVFFYSLKIPVKENQNNLIVKGDRIQDKVINIHFINDKQIQGGKYEYK